MNRRYKSFALTIIFGLCMFMLSFQTRAEDSNREEGRIMKVGYMDYKGFIETQNNGTYQGYAVSYLNEIAKYTGWTYEYCFDSWNNLLKKLANGEIDLLCSAQYTEERNQQYEFSNMSIGSESAVLYALPDREDLYYDDYGKIDGMTIGVLANSYQTEILPLYAKEQGFTYIEKNFSSETEMKQALEMGKIDLMVSGSLALHRDLKTISIFGSAPFYLITGKKNTDLMKPINQALIEIKDADPYFETKLYQNYYSISAITAEPLFTRQEAEYIQKSKPIEIGFLSEGYPLSAYNSKDKKCEGIVEDVVKKIADISGLEFEFVPVSSEIRPSEQLKRGDINIVAGMNRSETYLEDADLQVSNSMFEGSAVVVQKKGAAYQELNGLDIAVPLEYQYISDYLKNQYENCHILYADTTDECLAKVVSGEANIAVQNSYIISYLLQKPLYSKLTVFSTITIPETSCIIANNSVDPLLISVINKTIASIDNNTVQHIITDNTIANPYESSTSDIIYQYRWQFLFLILVLVILIISIVIVVRMRIAKALREKENYVLRIRAEYDSMTDIYNRDTFFEKVEAVLGKNPKVEYDIICMDIDRFKIVNDLLGAEEGDRLLKYVAQVLKATVDKRGGICGRIGGNSFAAYVPRDELAVKGLYEFAKNEINKFPIDMDLTMRFGIYCIDDVSISVIAMSERARMAMEKIKGNAFLHVGVYNQKQRMELLREQDIVNDMHHALEQEEFQVYIQPKCRLDSGEIVGGEALVRWIHPQKGMISPGEFISIFEKNGFITKLDEYMWKKTCEIISDRKQKGKKVLPISVNISRLNFYSNDLKSFLLDLIQKYDLRTDELELEITESALAEDDEVLFHEMHELQNAGFKILMDDFGSGYSSLNMLKEAPIDVIKIDLKFIQGSDPMGRSIDILSGVMMMAEAMKMPIIAEGVETEENVAMLKRIHCELAQGFYYSKPVPNEQFWALLEEQMKG